MFKKDTKLIQYKFLEVNQEFITDGKICKRFQQAEQS